MSRYIDADKLSPDCMFNKNGTTGFAISQSQIANAPTADVIPQEKIDQMIAEIESKIIKNKCCEQNRWERERNDTRLDDIDIIHKYCDRGGSR